ncbi:MAG: preprotein translocase subunit SecE [Bacteroidales bacterium]|nr:preprotein translocase subunit SecE [Bacteroidales bacterium]
MLKKFITYCKESYEELANKTTWPNRKELTHTAIVVLVASIIIAVIVFAEDSVFKFVMESVYPKA